MIFPEPFFRKEHIVTNFPEVGDTGPPPMSEMVIPREMMTVPNWKRVGDSLERTFLFPSRAAVTGFLLKLVRVSESMNHDAEFVVCGCVVVMTLTTPSAGNRLTLNDFALAKLASEFASTMGAKNSWKGGV